MQTHFIICQHTIEVKINYLAFLANNADSSMKRRDFIKLSSLSILPIIACKEKYKSLGRNSFDIAINSDMPTGHLIMESEQFAQGKSYDTNLLVVGAGIAGLTAAANAPDMDCIVCELSDRIGGSSGSETHNGVAFCQGAHYDLVYPKYFGEDCLRFFESLDILFFNKHAALWEYTDKQYLISTDYESQCFSGGQFRDDVLVEGEDLDKFMKFMDAQLGNFMLPTRLIDEKFRSLDQEDFLTYLNKHLSLSTDFIRAIDYQMFDDFSDEASKISALAGMYYYANRPYHTSEIEIFSPPEGNYYFAEKIATKIPEDQIWTKHLVKKISKVKEGFVAEVVDVATKSVKKVTATHLIYAGQKHALKYVFPEQHYLFEANQYAPWMVINFVLKENDLNKGYWQNEIIVPEKSFLGFVDSDAQFKKKDEARVLSAYYCFPQSGRENLANINRTAQQVVAQTTENIGWYFGMRPKKFKKIIEKVYIKVMGHGMPIPIPGYLFNDKNHKRKYKDLVFAGVDNSRLPLLLEAVDSGLCAINEIFSHKISTIL
ncbi:MAG: NAD(P)-binding protein [Bacteroidota bacterium]